MLRLRLVFFVRAILFGRLLEGAIHRVRFFGYRRRNGKRAPTKIARPNLRAPLGRHSAARASPRLPRSAPSLLRASPLQERATESFRAAHGRGGFAAATSPRPRLLSARAVLAAIGINLSAGVVGKRVAHVVRDQGGRLRQRVVRVAFRFVRHHQPLAGLTLPVQAPRLPSGARSPHRKLAAQFRDHPAPRAARRRTGGLCLPPRASAWLHRSCAHRVRRREAHRGIHTCGREPFRLAELNNRRRVIVLPDSTFPYAIRNRGFVARRERQRHSPTQLRLNPHAPRPPLPSRQAPMRFAGIRSWRRCARRSSLRASPRCTRSKQSTRERVWSAGPFFVPPVYRTPHWFQVRCEICLHISHRPQSFPQLARRLLRHPTSA